MPRAVPAEEAPTKPLHCYSLGLLGNGHLRRVLGLAGWHITSGWPDASGQVGVWGQKPVSARGRWVAGKAGCATLCVEDGFLHSVGDGQGRPISLVFDDLGIYFDARHPSRLEHILQDSDFPESLLGRAALGVTTLREKRLSKYTPGRVSRAPDPGYVLVVDQTYGDASIAGAGAEAATFRRMLEAARLENPGTQIVVKTHPRAGKGGRTGHFTAEMLLPGEILLQTPVDPWEVLEGATSIYCVSSQLGYEGLLANRPVRCFGQAFYASWGLTEDESRVTRRSRVLSRDELFAGAHLLYPVYFDPWRDQLGTFETAVDALYHQLAVERTSLDDDGDVFAGVRLWKRRYVPRFRPQGGPGPHHVETLDAAGEIARTGRRRVWAWASKYPRAEMQALRDTGVAVGAIEDGFLRSVGLGAALTEPSSLVFDKSGIYFDPEGASDLEMFVEQAVAGEADINRAAALREAIVAGGVTKYNLNGDGAVKVPPGRRVVLVPGQVEDDASILRGTTATRTNLDLLKLARASNPDAWLIYKPHPDVEAGLRTGQVPDAEARQLADDIALRSSPTALIDLSDEIWTMTSLMGFEALLRGKKVTCAGTPFYAGWGLTTDLDPPCLRRRARPSLDQLVWAALIAYPVYVDPVSGLPCSPELIVERLASGVPGARAGVLSKLQGALSPLSWLWR